MHGHCAASEKVSKRLNNRRLRRANKDASKEPKIMKEVSDPWDMPKDGKMIFDPNEWPEGMRK